MDPAPPAPDDTRPAHLLGALAIGVLTIGTVTSSFSLLTGRPLNLAEEWFNFLVQMGIVAAPFALMALAGIGNKWPWLAGLGLTLALWGYYLFEGVSYQWHPDGSGVNIGLAMIMLLSPIPITATCLGVWAWQRHARPA
jgi:hypothetical protein